MASKFFFLAGLAICFLLAGCKTPEQGTSITAGSAAQSTNTLAGTVFGDSGGYILQPLDPIYIRFSGIQEQMQLDLVIDEQGEISLLHLKEPVKAAGLTTSQLESLIERLYIDGGIYKTVSVNVTMTAKNYYVLGEVNQPGQFPLQTGTTLLQAIAGARGPNAFANLKKVTISRKGKLKTFNYKKLEENPSLDVKIEAGDVIKVWQKWY